jgi:hypothetical protein
MIELSITTVIHPDARPSLNYRMIDISNSSQDMNNAIATIGRAAHLAVGQR